MLFFEHNKSTLFLQTGKNDNFVYSSITLSPRTTFGKRYSVFQKKLSYNYEFIRHTAYNYVKRCVGAHFTLCVYKKQRHNPKSLNRVGMYHKTNVKL
jgi:hypothetical protein